ncbi:MAG: DUF2378 family protein [Myxococcota bacterium]
MSADVPQGFAAPSFEAEDDTDVRLAQLPRDGWVRGMFMQEVVDEARSRGVLLNHDFTAFHKYPLSEFLRLLQEGAKRIFPDRSFSRALYSLGSLSYPNFAKSMAGRALFAVAGTDFRRVLELAGRGYAVTVHPGDVSVRFVGERSARVHMRHIWAFPATYQVGVLSGAMRATNVQGDVFIRENGLDDVELFIRW